jgi:hypothetical protein
MSEEAIKEAAYEATPGAQIVRNDGDLLVYYSGFNLSKFVRFLALRAAPASEPVAWTDDKIAGWARNWHWNDCAEDKPVDPSIYFRDMRMLKAFLAALPSSPAPITASHNSGERLPSSDAAEGAGETIFEECTEIALEHIGTWGEYHKPGYDDACNDIAEAIKLRASNRKRMDALAKDRGHE